MLKGYAMESIALGLRLAAVLFIVRWLPKAEYGWYVTGWAMISATVGISNSGVNAMTMGFGGAAGDDRSRLSAVIRSGLAVRQRNWLFVSIAIAPLLALLLHRQGASGWTIVGIVVMQLLASHLQLTLGTLSVVPKLEQDTAFLYCNSILKEGIRLFAMFALLAIAPLAVSGLLASVLSVSIVVMWTSRITQRYLISDVTANPTVVARLNREVLRQFPGALHQSVSGILGLALLSAFANVEKVAELGALSRVGLLFAAIGPTLRAFVFPLVSRMPTAAAVRRSFFHTSLALSIVGTIGVGLVWLASPQILSFLGHDYKGLERELTLAAAIAASSLVSQATRGTVAARGVLPPSLWVALATISVQAIAILTGDMSRLFNVIALGLIPVVINSAVDFYLLRQVNDDIPTSQPTTPVQIARSDRQQSMHI